MDLHPVEAAWRRFRNGPHADLLGKSVETRASYLRFIRMGRCQTESCYPAPSPGISPRSKRRTLGASGPEKRSAIEGSLLVNTINPGRSTARWSSLLHHRAGATDCLARSPWPDRTPTPALRLPSRCPVLALPWKSETVYIAAAYDLVTGAEESGALGVAHQQVRGRSLGADLGPAFSHAMTCASVSRLPRPKPRAHSGFDQTAEVWQNRYGRPGADSPALPGGRA
jgi:hypothetical protein